MSVTENAYLYRREDNGELVEVSWLVMIHQQGGYITLPDGVTARRCLHLETDRDGRPPPSEKPHLDRPIVSDALGFGEHQLADFEEDRKRNRFTGIEFTRDPQVPEFFQVRCKSRAEFNRYTKHRGMVNRSSFGGVRLTQADLDRAKELVERGHP